MSRVQDHGVIVHCLPYSETSMIAIWMTEGHGILRTLAKGARRPKQAFFGKLDVYRQGHLGFKPSRSSQLHTLIDFTPERLYSGVVSDYGRSLCASYFYEIVARLSEPQHAQPEVHQLYLKAMDYLDRKDPTTSLVERFERRLFEHLGLYETTQSARILRNRLLHPPPKTWKRLEEILHHPSRNNE